MMIGMMAVTPTADTFPSILIGIPGSNSSQSTVLDGFPMSQRGEAARALSAAFASSLIGGIIGAVFLTAAIYVALPLLLLIGFGEQLVLILIALTMVGTLTGASPLKGLATCGLGLLIGDNRDCTATGTRAYLRYGLPDRRRRRSRSSASACSPCPRSSIWCAGSHHFRDRHEPRPRLDPGREGHRPPLAHRPALLDARRVIGALPGLGGSVINWVSYSHVVQIAKDGHASAKATCAA